MQISINACTDIVYVGGTVNGIEVVFDKMSGHIYTAEVEQPFDDIYRFDLQFIDEAGNKSTYRETIEYFLPYFIYDRTQADVDRVKYLNERYLKREITDNEINEWNTGINGKLGLKGALNLSDIKRNENNCNIIGGLVAAAVSIKKWDYGDIPRASDYARIRNNVQKIRNAWIALSDTPEVPEQPLNTYQKWNDIERILHDVYYTYVRIKNSYYYCDAEMYAGEGIGDI